jgi:hypothetical protein
MWRDLAQVCAPRARLGAFSPQALRGASDGGALGLRPFSFQREKNPNKEAVWRRLNSMYSVPSHVAGRNGASETGYSQV